MKFLEERIKIQEEWAEKKGIWNGLIKKQKHNTLVFHNEMKLCKN